MSNTPESQERQAVIVRALAQLKQMQAKLDALEGAQREPIAIIGMACRVPGGAGDPESLWKLLDAGVDAIGEIPANRWNRDAFYDQNPDAPGRMYTRHGGFLDQVDTFDADFFGISPREAASMDPQQRLLLEAAWEALESAGQAPDKLLGSRTGVFVGIGIDDYKQLQLASGDPTQIDAYSGTGSLFCVAAGRISYFLGLQGPTLAVDTGCSSSLVAIHLACQSLRADECTMAMAGGVHLMLSPEMTIFLSKARALSADGRCKTFDASADGYARGEGCGMIVLKKLSRALADGDPILAVIRGSAINHDGRSSGLTVPNGLAQQTLIREALARAGVSPSQIDYVEAHGTGTSLGDPIEVQALAAALGEGRPKDQPLRIGSVKTNIGHLEAAAGVVGLIKVVMALRHERIPRPLHLKEPSPRIPWSDLPVVVPNEPTPWPRSERSRLAGVSSFGISGTNAHVIVEEAPVAPPQEGAPLRNPQGERASAFVLPLSAYHPEALKALASAYRAELVGSAAPALEDLCHSAAVRRAHFDHRLAVLGRSREEIAQGLEAFLRGEAQPSVASGQRIPGTRRKLVFVFPGQGSQWLGMGRQLLREEPVFAAELEACDKAIRAYTDWSLLEELAADGDRSHLTRIDVVQPVLFALQVALAALWRSWGITPDAVVGHSMGEVAASHVAGALSLDEAARIICRRSSLLRRVSGRGAMAMVELPLQQAQRAIAGYESRLAIAVNNGPRSTVLSGDPAALEEVLDQLQKQDVFCRRIKVDVASHSPQMDPLRTDLFEVLTGVQPRAATVAMYSTVNGAVCEGPELDADYWVRNLREPVLFWSAIQRLVGEGYDTFIEISPHPILLPAIEQGLQSVGQGGVVLASLRREEDERAAMLGSLGRLYSLGGSADWSRIYASGRCVRLPNYPWQRKRHWVSQERRARKSPASGHPLLGRRLRSALKAVQFEVELHPDAPSFLADHIIHGAVVVPGASHTAMALCATSAFGADACTLEQVSFIQALVLGEEGRVVQLVLNPEEGRGFDLQVLSSEATEKNENPSWTTHATGRFFVGAQGGPGAIDARDLLEALRSRCPELVTGEAFYRDFWAAGYQLGPSFRWIKEIWRRDGEALARLEVAEGAEDVHHYRLHPTLIDACFQMACAAFPGGVPFILEVGDIYVPFGINRLKLYTRYRGPLWCHAVLREGDAQRKELFILDLRLFDGAGQVVADVEGLHLKRARRDLLLGGGRERREDWFYEIRWELEARPEKAPARPSSGEAGRWLVIGDRGGFGQSLAAALEQRGEACVVVSHTEASVPGPGRVDLERPEAFRELLAELFGKGQPPCRGVIHLASLDAASGAAVNAASLDAAQVLGAGSVISLLQALLQAGWRDLPRVWLVTRGTQAAGESQEPLAVASAPLWGLGRVIAHEHPELRCARLDLSPVGGPDELSSLLDEILADGEEDQIALRREGRYVARLARCRVPEVPTALRADGTYLITGGLGGLGLIFARWMVEQGARHLVLVGRRGPSETAKELLATLEQTGAQIVVASADVAREEQMAEVFARIQQNMPPLRGVIHAAGVLDDGVLLQQSLTRLRAVTPPKIQGAWILHSLSLEAPLDFFVLCSSAASLLGVPGQGNYAAANAFLDALAHHRRALGLPAQSINWGPWAEVGLAAAQANRGERLAARGLVSISPDKGIAALASLLGHSAAQVGVMSLDLRQWREFYVAAGSSPLFKKLLVEQGGAAPEGKRAQFREVLRAAEPGARRALLEGHLREQIGLVVKRSPSEIQTTTPFGALGLDSLMSLEIRNRLEASLGLTLSATLVWGYPSVGALATYLDDKLKLALEPAKPSASPRENTMREAGATRGSTPEQLSERDMAALLAEELAAAKRLRRSR